MHAYRTHTCAALTRADVGETVRLSGWVHRKRDHGGVLFVDLRDHYGITQIVADSDSPALRGAREAAAGERRDDRRRRSRRAARARSTRTCRPARSRCSRASVTVQSRAEELPLPVAGEQEYPEEIRLKYRFVDLRRETLHANIMLRTEVIASLRRRMEEQGFTEFQTPILTASQPRRRARLPGAEPPPPGQLLRAARRRRRCSSSC